MVIGEGRERSGGRGLVRQLVLGSLFQEGFLCFCIAFNLYIAVNICICRHMYVVNCPKL